MKYIHRRNNDRHRLTNYTLSELIAELQNIKKQYGDMDVKGDLEDWNSYALGLDLTVYEGDDETMMELCPIVLYGKDEDEDETEWEKVK